MRTELRFQAKAQTLGEPPQEDVEIEIRGQPERVDAWVTEIRKTMKSMEIMQGYKEI